MTRKTKNSKQIITWDGIQDKLELVKNATQRIIDAYPAANTFCQAKGWDLTNLICRGINHPWEIEGLSEVEELTNAHRNLRDLSAELQRNHNISFELIRGVYAPMLYPGAN